MTMNPTIVVPTSVWEDTQKTIREMTAIISRIKRDERDALLARTTKNLAAEFRALGYAPERGGRFGRRRVP